MSQRDGTIVAWHEVPGKAPPQQSRPVGYGVIRAGVRTDSRIAAHISTASDHTVPYGTVVSTAAFPGTSCQATIGVVPPGHGFQTFRRIRCDSGRCAHRFEDCGAHFDCVRSHRTLRDGCFEGRFSRHFVPVYDRCCRTGRAGRHFAIASS
jgi:hypothetical protein